MRSRVFFLCFCAFVLCKTSCTLTWVYVHVQAHARAVPVPVPCSFSLVRKAYASLPGASILFLYNATSPSQLPEAVFQTGSNLPVRYDQAALFIPRDENELFIHSGIQFVQTGQDMT